MTDDQREPPEVGGWFALRRGWREHLPLRFAPLSEIEAALWSVEMAAFRRHLRWFNGSRVLLERGQLVTSHQAMMKAFGWSVKKVRGFEARLLKAGFWAVERAPLYSVITVCNFDHISPPLALPGHPPSQPADNSRAATRPPREQRNNKTNRQMSESARPRHSELSKDFMPNIHDREALRIANGWSTDRQSMELRKFRLHYAASGQTCADWNAKWCSWIIRAADFEPVEQSGFRNGLTRAAASVIAERSDNPYLIRANSADDEICF